MFLGILRGTWMIFARPFMVERKLVCFEQFHFSNFFHDAETHHESPDYKVEVSDLVSSEEFVILNLLLKKGDWSQISLDCLLLSFSLFLAGSPWPINNLHGVDESNRVKMNSYASIELVPKLRLIHRLALVDTCKNGEENSYTSLELVPRLLNTSLLARLIDILEYRGDQKRL